MNILNIFGFRKLTSPSKSWYDKENYTTEGLSMCEQTTQNLRESEDLRNSDLSFLHKKLNIKNHPSLAYWISIDEFANRVREIIPTNNLIGERTVFEIIKPIYLKHQENAENEGKSVFNLHLARKLVNELSIILTGSKDGWGYTPKDPYPIVIMDEYKELAYLEGVLHMLKKGSLRHIFQSVDIMEAFKKHGVVDNPVDAYHIFKTVFYTMVENDYPHIPEKRKEYNWMRNIANDFSVSVFKDKDFWHIDYNATHGN